MRKTTTLPARTFSLQGLLLGGILLVVLSSSTTVTGQDGGKADPLTYASELARVTNDHALNDLAVLTADRLCAVGNCGVILRSENAGRSWTRVPNLDPANLHDVHFVSPNLGIAVGGTIGSYTRTSEARIFRTLDGGRTWQKQLTELPRLLGLQDSNGRLIAWGDYSPKHQTGLFESHNQGIDWVPVRVPTGHIRFASQSPTGEILLGDASGRCFFRNLNGRTEEITELANQDIVGVHHSGREWFAYGQRGRLLASSDGMRWRSISVPLSEEALKCCDWIKVSQLGQTIWLGGSPGSILLCSRDLGATWEIQSTNQTLPTRAIAFLDDSRGWFVGPLGAIHATRDGGEQWYCQRFPARRLGILSVSDRREETPWEPLLAASWDKQVSVAAHFLSPEASEFVDFLPSVEQQLGAVGPQLGLTWIHDTVPAKQDANAEIQRLAVDILCWRPSVIVAGQSLGEDGQETNNLTPALHAAQQYAASADFGVARELKLFSWTVEKTVQVTTASKGRYSERSNRLLNSIGLAISDVMLPLPMQERGMEPVALVTAWSNSRNQASASELLGAVTFDEAVSREVTTNGIGNYQLVMGRVHLRKSLDELLNDRGTEQTWKQNLEFVLKTLPQHDVVPTLIDLATRLGETKLFDRRQFVLERIRDLMPGTDAARYAALMLLQESASQEMAAWRQSELENATGVSLVFSDQPNSAGNRGGQGVSPWNASPFETEIQESPGVVSAAASQTVSRPSIDAQDWFQTLASYSQASPGLDARPDMRVLAYRMSCRFTGDERPNVQKLESLLHASELGDWPQVAIQEYQYANNSIDNSQRIALSAWADKRPLLDGVLDEPLWQAAPPMLLTSMDEAASASTRVKCGYDRNYLYIALESRWDSHPDAGEPQRIRSYDSDLTAMDHVQLTLDVDRDYATAVELAVASDGRTYDRCCGKAAYNPKWHVFVKREPERWVAEIAIEQVYLTPDSNLIGDAWAISAKRFNGKHQVASWQPLSANGAKQSQRSGLLLFIPPRQESLR